MRKIYLIICALCALALSIPVACAADPLTHLGQPVENLVTVRCTSCTMVPGPNISQYSMNGHAHTLLPSGTESPFVIPDGQVFVITDVEWWSLSGNNPKTGNVSFIISLVKKGNNDNIVAFISKSVPIISRSFSGHESLTAGIVVASGADIIPELWGVDSNVSASVSLHGYLMQAPPPPSPKMSAPKQNCPPSGCGSLVPAK